MADPVSAAGTAVGVISLGIQTCQGLVSYCEKWKSFDDDIAHLQIQIDELRKTLENLDHILQKFQNSNVAILKDVEMKIVSANDGIRNLKAVLDKCHASGSPNSVQGKANKLWKHASYIFKKTTLQELKSNVTDLHYNLNTSLQTLGLDTLGDQHQLVLSASQNATEKMKEIKHDTGIINANVEVIHDELPKILQQTNVIQTATSYISSTLDTRLEDLQTCQQNTLPQLKNYMEALPDIIESRIKLQFNDYLEQMIERMQNPQLSRLQHIAEMRNSAQPMRAVQARLLAKPSLLRDVCDEITGQENPIQLSSISEYQPFRESSCRRYFKRPRCTCRPSTYFVSAGLQYLGRRWSAMLNTSAMTHAKDCALFYNSESESSFNLKVMYCGRLIGQAVTASVYLRRGAGGFSISPSLSCIRVVSSDSPAFKVLASFLSKWYYSPLSSPTLESLNRALVELFQDGHASAHDVNEKGQNLLHIVSENLTTNDYHKGPTEDKYSLLIGNLCRLGVPINQVDNQGLTSLDIVESIASYNLSRSCLLMVPNVSSRMLDLGAEYGENWSKRPSGGFLSEYSIQARAARAARSPEFAEALNLNDICQAILCRSESRLVAAIEKYSHQINEPCSLGVTPLHLSAGWSRGIEILLEHGADVNVTDRWGRYPVEYAASQTCAECLRLFDETDCALHQSLMRAVESQSYLDDGNESQHADIVDLVIEMEANRRRKLQSLLSLSMPERVLSSLSLFEDRILDQQVPAAMAASKRHNISVPPSLQPDQDGGTVYHCNFLTLRNLNSLWEAGFRDVNGLDRTGHTPLMALYNKTWYRDIQDQLEITGWFEEKGVDIHQKVQFLHQDSEFESGCRFGCSCRKSGYTVLHYVCHCRGSSYNWWDSIIIWDNMSYANLRRMLLNEIQDDCKCACSSAGCRALCMFVKRRRFNWDIRRHYRGTSHTRRSIYTSFYSFIDPDGTTSDLVLSDLVRFLTFEWLDLTHTCCRESYDTNLLSVPFEDDEIQEIHNEEHEDLQLLENLMIEFDQNRRELGYPLARFIGEYWQPRMKEVLSEQKPMDYEKVREIGVVLHDSDIKSEDGCSSLNNNLIEGEDGSEDEDEDEEEAKDEDKAKDADKEEDEDEDEDKDGRKKVNVRRSEERT